MKAAAATAPLRRVDPALAKEAVIGLIRAADAVRRRFIAVVGREGITLQQFNVLRILRGAGPGGLPTLTIVARMVEHEPGITRLLDRLEAKALVRRERRPGDRRRVHVTIAEAGLDLLGRLDVPVAAADAEVVRPLPAAHLAELVRLLEAVRGAADPGPTAPDGTLPSGVAVVRAQPLPAASGAPPPRPRRSRGTKDSSTDSSTRR